LAQRLFPVKVREKDMVGCGAGPRVFGCRPARLDPSFLYKPWRAISRRWSSQFCLDAGLSAEPSMQGKCQGRRV